ncbi:RecB family exonuclease [Nonomuraea sp. NPDC059007]|uniref:RecB family exonuclease n=1 Tax=Nonomuraea sp. NPDC059007 TaxID=3346692 RepID=UPI0036B37380
MSIPTRQRRRSTSQLLAYAACGKRYELERLERVPQIKAAWTIQGTAVHGGAEFWEKSDRAAEAGEVLEVYELIWDQEYEKAVEEWPQVHEWFRGGRKAAVKDIQDRRVLGAEQLVTYMEYSMDDRLQPWRLPDGNPASEVEFMVPFGSVWVTGKIDMIMEDTETGMIVVRDLKTGNEPHEHIQLKTYAHAVEYLFGEVVEWGDYFLCKQGGPSAPVDLAVISLDRLVERYEEMDAAEKLGYYLAAPSNENCRFCSVQRSCPDFF